MTIARAYTTYNPLHVFGGVGLALAFIGLMPMLRFLWFALHGDTTGHIQSLVIGGAVLVLGAITFLLGILADLISANRKLAEATLEKLRRMEARLEQQVDVSRPATAVEVGSIAQAKRHRTP